MLKWFLIASFAFVGATGLSLMVGWNPINSDAGADGLGRVNTGSVVDGGKLVSLMPARKFQVGVTGKEFRWHFTYPGADGILNTSDDMPVGNHLVVPTRSTIDFVIQSEDYVYVLVIPGTDSDIRGPELNANTAQKVRELAIPNLEHRLSLGSGVEELGVDLMVDPSCGFRLIHDPRMGHIEVNDEADYSGRIPLVAINEGANASTDLDAESLVKQVAIQGASR